MQMVQYDDDDKITSIYRSDMTKEKDKKEMIAIAAASDGKCKGSDYAPLDDYFEVLKTYSETVFDELKDVTWKNKKEDVKFKGKKCTAYYNDDIDGSAIYVYDGYLYAVHSSSDDTTILEYEWDVPMDTFVLKDCKSEDKRFAETPSEDFVFCASNSVKVAFVAILVALLSALF